MKTRIIILAAAAILLISSCNSSGVLMSSTLTNVELNKGNYKIVTTSLTGTAKAGYLFGASLGVGMYAQTAALIPLTKDRQLYKLAVQDLWKNYETAHGSPVGKKLALINIRYDTDILNTFFYTRPKLTIIADVIEFTD